MYYPQEVLDEVLANTDIVDVISAHVHLKKRGKNYIGLCPFHNEKTPSFNVSPDKNMFYCFGCGTGGSAITFLMKYNNSTFQEALQELADRARITLPAPDMSEESKKREKHRQDLLAINKETATYYYKLLRSRRGERGMRYFNERQLSPETMKMFGLGFADGAGNDLTAYLRGKGFSDELILEADVAMFNEKQGLHDRFWNRVMFPIQDVRGRVIGFGGRVLGDSKPKYINSSDTKIFDKGRNLYALNLARRSKKDYLILCEGYMDVIAMHQAGFIEAVASLGTAFTPGQASLLRRYTGRVLLAYDSDGAGVRAALRNIGILRNGGLDTAVIDLRPHKDPDEFIKAEGKEAFQQRIDNAENSFFYELRMISRNYKMDDPASRTAFHREIAKKLCTFEDEIERDNYIVACADKYFIKAESLRRLVASYGRVTGYGDPESRGSLDRTGRNSSGQYPGGTGLSGFRSQSGTGGQNGINSRNTSDSHNGTDARNPQGSRTQRAGQSTVDGRSGQSTVDGRNGQNAVDGRNGQPGGAGRTGGDNRSDRSGQIVGDNRSGRSGKTGGDNRSDRSGQIVGDNRSGRSGQYGRGSQNTGVSQAFGKDQNGTDGRSAAAAAQEAGGHSQRPENAQARQIRGGGNFQDGPAVRPLRNPASSAVSRAELANLNKQRMLLTLIVDQPAVFPIVKQYLVPGDFEGELFRKAAGILWTHMENGGGSASAAGVISAFDTQEEQEAAAAMFNTHLSGGEEEPDSGELSRILRELIISVKESSVERMSRPGETSASLQELLAAKKQLQTLRTAKFKI